ncbi:hypothetical protein FHS76_003208 [Ochrobactrum daejeonense]|uniref:Uncharacterized protein n=1 Tax=Brucella daejeonensis TaxID=659015 RepID=A0A7W9AZ64_9HYPH|nr:hypothetical protein [Brucella daejeonensis]MBB5703308.1 hypothetical protein [Brucella daejeonensis]
MRNTDSACIAAPSVPAARPGPSAFFRRLFARRKARIVITEYSPEYLLRDIGLREGRRPHYSREGHKLPEWR